MVSDRVAIVGLSCRLPQAPDVASFWQLIERRDAAFVPLPAERWDPSVYAADLPPGVSVAPRAGLSDEVDLDWRALRLPPLDAEKLHRAERAGLAAMTEALFDANVLADPALRQRTRIFVASSRLGPDPRTDISRRIRRFELQGPVSVALAAHAADQQEEVDDVLGRLFDLAAPAIDPDFLAATASLIAGRMANLLDLNGGHLAIDAGNTSSLAAFVQASQALQSGACDVALVCGLSPLITPSTLLAFAHRRWLSANEPQPFGADAAGTMLGEGAVAFVLMRAPEVGARRVYACVDACASSFTAMDPSSADVERAVADAARACALQLADTNAAVVSVETAAMGVPGYDAAEARGLMAVWGTSAAPALLSSTVANVGFLSAGAGAVSLLKAVLSLAHGRSIPHAHAPFTPPDASAGTTLRCGGAEVALSPTARIVVSDAGFSPLAVQVVLSAATTVLPTTTRARAASDPDDAIAIVGLGVVAPGSPDVPAFWRGVLHRIDAVGDLPPGRFDVDAVIGTSKEVGALLRTRLAATVDVPLFSAERYGLSAGAGDGMDASVVLALEVARQALADAAGSPGRESVPVGGWDLARVGVYLGQLPYRVRDSDVERRVLSSLYLALTGDAMRECEVPPEHAARVLGAVRKALDVSMPHIDAGAVLAQTGVTAAAAIAEANGFRGAVMSVDAACASSLAALELAMLALRRGEIDAAVAGGVAFNLLPEYYVALSMLGVLSPRGEPPFSIDATGFVPGEGAGCAVLMRVGDARRQQRRIYATIRAIGASSDGRGLSIFAPSVPGQMLAVRRALDGAVVPAHSVDLIEAHGTGTKLGDETELKTYRAIYGARDASAPATLGSIKSQLGHLSAAAGIVALAKVALALHEHTLPPSLFEVERRTMLTNDDTALDVSSTARGWPTVPGRARRACVSSFGLGGVNFHAILEEHGRIEPTVVEPALSPGRGPRADRFEVALVPLSLPVRAPLFPLAGRRVLVAADAGDRCPAVVEQLRARGAEAVVLPADVEEASIQSTLTALATGRSFDAVIDLSACDSLLSPLASERSIVWHGAVAQRLARAMAVLRFVYDDFAQAAPATRAYAVVTTMGGDMGLMGAGGDHVHGAALLGLAKGFQQELPAVQARGIDFATHEDPQRLASLTLAEIEDGNDRLEVGYGDARFVVNLVRAPLAQEPRTPCALPVGSVYLFSGGGRGVVFECALALARAGVKVIVTGRTKAPAGDEPWLSLDDAGFQRFRTDELLRSRAQDASLTPVRFAAEFDVIVRQRELWANLERARALEISLRYVVCDIGDEASVRATIAAVRQTEGHIHGVVHGAMVEWSTSLPRKTAAMIEGTLRAKSLGFLHLLHATEDDPPQQMICFGSGAGRFGSKGQADYCAANALLAALSTACAARAPSTRFVTIDWTAWSQTGAAARDPDMAALVAATGISSVRSSEGTYWFLTELLRGRGHESVIFEERMLSSLRGLGESAEGSGARTIACDDTGAPLVPGRWPLVDVLLTHQTDRLTYQRTFEVERDAFLSQHVLDSAPILPGTFGCELLAEAAALLSPGWEIEAGLDVQIGAPAKLHRHEPLTLRVSAVLVDHTSDRRIIECESRSDLIRHGRVLQRDRLHHRGRFLLRRQGTAPSERVVIPEWGARVRARSFFHMAKDPVALGPLFCRAAWLQIVGTEVTGDLRPPRQRDILGTSSYPFFQVDPLTMDGAFQVAANWDGLINGWVSIPTGIGGFSMGRTRARGEGVRVWARVVRVSDPVVHYDIDVTGDDAELLLQVRGLKLHRVARLAGHDD